MRAAPLCWVEIFVKVGTRLLTNHGIITLSVIAALVVFIVIGLMFLGMLGSAARRAKLSAKRHPLVLGPGGPDEKWAKCERPGSAGPASRFMDRMRIAPQKRLVGVC